MGRRALAPGDGALVVEEHVVQDQDLLAVGRAVVVRVRREDQEVPEEPQVLLHVLADVGVVPEHPGVGHVELVEEALPPLDGVLGHARHAVELVAEPEPVPVDGGGHLDLVGHPHHDAGVLGRLDEGSRVLAVVAVHDHLVAGDGAPHHGDRHVQRVPVGHLHDPGRLRLREHGDVHPHGREEGAHHGDGVLQPREHGHLHVHGGHAPPAGHVHVHHVALVLGPGRRRYEEEGEGGEGEGPHRGRDGGPALPQL